MKKKILAGVMLATMIFSVTACSSDKEVTEKSTTEKMNNEENVSTEESVSTEAENNSLNEEDYFSKADSDEVAKSIGTVYCNMVDYAISDRKAPSFSMYSGNGASTRYYQDHLCEKSWLLDKTSEYINSIGLKRYYESNFMSTKYKVTDYTVEKSWLNTEPDEDGYYEGQCELLYTITDDTNTSSAREIPCNTVLSYKLGYNTAKDTYMLYELEDRGDNGKMDIQNADDVLSNVISQDSVLIGDYTSDYMENTKCNISYVNNTLRVEGETSTNGLYQPYWLQNGLPNILEAVEGSDNLYNYSFNISEGKVCKEPYYYNGYTIDAIYSYEKDGMTFFLYLSYNIEKKELSVSIHDDIDNKTRHGFSLFS